MCKNIPLSRIGFACVLSFCLSLAPLPLSFNPSASCRSVRLPVSVPIRFHLIHVTSINMQSSSDKSRPLSLPPLCRRHRRLHCSSCIILFSSAEHFAVESQIVHVRHVRSERGFESCFAFYLRNPYILISEFQDAFVSLFIFLLLYFQKPN